MAFAGAWCEPVQTLQKGATRSLTYKTLQSLVRSLGQHGTTTAVLQVGELRAKRLSYGELCQYILRLATGLANEGLSAGDRCVLCAPNSPEWIVACLALLEAGAIPVPVDSQASEQDLEHIMDDCGAAWIFTNVRSARRFGQGAAHLSRLVLLDEAGEPGVFWRDLLAAPRDGPAAAPSPGDCAILFYTSGTSGQPKGVPLSHVNIVSNLSAVLAQQLVQADDRLLLPLPLHHVYPFVVGLLVALSSGITIILPRSLTGTQLQRALHQGDATIVLGVPRLYQVLVTAIEQALSTRGWFAVLGYRAMLRMAVTLRRRVRLDAGKWLFAVVRRRLAPRLRLLVSGGSALAPKLAWTLEGLGWRVATGYGLTETSPILTFNAPGSRRMDSAGKPLPGVRVRTARPAPGFLHGELLAKGPNVFAGYHNLPDKSAEAFTEEGWFRTGDLGYLDRLGYLHLRGRVSSMIVLPGGENVDPERLEEALTVCPSIREVGVVEHAGGLIGVVVPTPEAVRDHDERALKSLLSDEIGAVARSLPSFQRLNQVIVDHTPLPRTRLGKLRRQDLLEVFHGLQSGPSVPSKPGLAVAAELAPEDRQLLEDPVAAKLWAWLGQRFPGHAVNPDTNLRLDLQIDSMDWLNLTLEIRDRVGVELAAEAVARVETIRDLLYESVAADHATSQGEDQLTALREPEAALTDAQRAWLAPQSPGLAAFGLCLAWLAQLVMRAFFRLRIVGLENLPSRAPFMLVPNHISALDPIAVAAALGRTRLRDTYWGGWVGIMFDRPVMRLVSRAMRVLPVEAQRGSLWSLELGAAALNRGHNLIWFPEGERSPTGDLQPFRAGAARLLQAQPVPVVPVWIEGTREALPPGKLWPKRRRLSITLGGALEAEQLAAMGQGPGTADAITAALHARVQALGESVRMENVSR
jgi:long-chain acyl-CoA synthetase